MTKVIRALVVLVKDAVAVTVLSQQEAAPGKTAVHLVFRVDTGSVFKNMLVVFHGIDSRHLVLVANEVRTTDVDVEAHRQVEH